MNDESVMYSMCMSADLWNLACELAASTLDAFAATETSETQACWHKICAAGHCHASLRPPGRIRAQF